MTFLPYRISTCIPAFQPVLSQIFVIIAHIFMLTGTRTLLLVNDSTRAQNTRGLRAIHPKILQDIPFVKYM